MMLQKKILRILVLFGIIIISMDTMVYGNFPGGNPIINDSSKIAVPGPFFKIDVQWFLGYQYSENDGDVSNLFQIKRGYLNFRTDLNDRFSARITPDISQDREGDGRGDIELRLKYLYMKYKLNSNSVFTKPALVFGLSQRPWIDFEQHINPYRVQGKMYAERYGMVNSADFGVTFTSLLGGEMSAAYKKNISKNEAGRFGSFAVGIYNGGGYHAIEENNNKTIETRLTIRPFPDVFPGLQATYTGAYGKGNIPEEPDFIFNNAFLSLQQEHLTVTSQYMWGRGNFRGNYENDPYTGYSAFADANLPGTKIDLFVRYDDFILEREGLNLHQKTMIGGIAYTLVGSSKILFDVDRMATIEGEITSYRTIYEIAVEVRF